jgi:hypothetical protein
MTILTACQDAAVKLNQTRPSSVFSASGGGVAFANELVLAANETAEAVVGGYDWQKLTTLATFTGDGTTEAFDLPSDYVRMIKKAKVHSLAWQNAVFAQAKDKDDWLYAKDIAITGTPGIWIILGGQMQIFPAMAVGETARFYYISNLVIAPNTGDNKATFTLDSDTLRLPEEMLRLGIVWRWRANKRMEYAEDLENFETSMAQIYGPDKGSSILTVGRRRLPASVDIAYPGTITS